MMSCYQKFYTNHIHSSSLLCQLATMWKSQVLCDAIIRTGNIITKAHRVVLVAACPMLQSMENASMGSHLEVRLASDIKQDSVHTFLQYLYEGYMMLTEENCKDVEKIARLLQVDSVIKCISDFYKCLSAKTGCVIDDRYKYSSFDLMEFKHVRSSSIQKTLPETALKRGSELNRPSSPGHKRQRLGRPSSPLMRSSQRADDTLSMAHSYGGSHGSREPWDQGGRLGGRVPPQPGVIDIVEDSIEIIQTDRNEKDPLRSDGRMKQKSVSIAVTSQYNTPTDLQVVSMGDPDGVSSNSTQQTSEMLHNSSSQGSITVSPIPLFSDTSSTSAHTKPPDIQQEMPSVRPNIPPSQPVFPTLTPMHRPPHSSSSKPFAAGSASQSFISSSPQSRKADTLPSSNTNQDHKGENNSNDSNTPSTSADKAPDITIVKVESNTDHNTEGLDMYVDMPDDGIMRLQGMDDSQNDEGSDIEHVEQDQSADWSKEDMSNEGSNLGIDQNNSWYIDQFKEPTTGGENAKSGTTNPTTGRRRGRKPTSQTIQRRLDQQHRRLSEPSFYLKSSGLLDYPSLHVNSHEQPTVPAASQNIFRYTADIPGMPGYASGNFQSEDHRITQTEGSKYKPCVLCQINKVKTKSGWYVYTYYKCEQCDVPLWVADNSTRLDSSHVDDIKMQKINAAIGLFRGWLTSENFPTSFENFTLQALNDALEQFSSDFRSKHGQNTYSENTLKDIRECLFTYLQGHSSEWNANLIQHANVQNSFQMTDLMKESYSKSQFQKQKVFIKVPMTTDDVKQLMNSGMFNTETPLGLFRKIWFDLVLHLGIGGQAAMRSLTFDSFLSETDEKGRRYYRLNPDGVDRNQARSCMEMQYWCWDGRMYEVADDPFCPVKSMDAYIEKRNFARDSFFQRPKSSLHYLERSWFESPVGHSVLACLMTRMSEESKLQKTYTNSSVRITLADLLDAQGFDVVDILGSNPRIKMTKTGCGIHRNLSSDQRYQNSQVIHNAYYRFLEKEKK